MIELKGGIIVGRPKGSKNRKYSYEFKLKVIKEYLEDHLSLLELEEKYGVVHSVIIQWTRLYNEGLLKTGRKRTGNPFSALHTSKSLSREERLELENLKLKIENERLKKGYTVKGGGAGKEYVSIFDANTGSSEN
jgi:transposase-like protein